MPSVDALVFYGGLSNRGTRLWEGCAIWPMCLTRARLILRSLPEPREGAQRVFHRWF
jgi:hypothetical protein